MVGRSTSNDSRLTCPCGRRSLPGRPRLLAGLDGGTEAASTALATPTASALPLASQSALSVSLRTALGQASHSFTVTHVGPSLDGCPEGFTRRRGTPPPAARPPCHKPASVGARRLLSAQRRPWLLAQLGPSIASCLCDKSGQARGRERRADVGFGGRRRLRPRPNQPSCGQLPGRHLCRTRLKGVPLSQVRP
jgi:hypothetical protein